MRPNIVVVLADDLGYSDLGCYGGELDTPHLDAIAQGGVRLSEFYTTARCSPSRASLLTGLHQHQVGIGVLNSDDRPDGYRGDLSSAGATIAEILKQEEYATGVIGKWHVSSDVHHPSASWPTRRGFDYFYGNLTGCASFFDPGTLTRGEKGVEHEARLDPDFYYTDAISDEAVGFIEDKADHERPFFLYVAYTAPHFPLHALEEDIENYRGRFDTGWDDLRRARWIRQRSLGIADDSMPLSERDPTVPAWDEADHKDWEARRMEVYAAQVTSMDRGIGRIRDALKRRGVLDDTVFIFLSDNGASPEELPILDLWDRTELVPHFTRDGLPVNYGNDPQITPGPESTYGSYGRSWANLSNTPFRMYKKWNHEGGIAAPFIAHWPNGGLAQGSIVRIPAQVTSVLPTLLEAADIQFPDQVNGETRLRPEGNSILGALRGESFDSSQPLFFEHIGNAAMRQGRWKIVREFRREWELYDLELDRSEEDDLAARHPQLVATMAAEWQAWADRVGVIPFEQVVAHYEREGLSEAHAAG